MPAPFRTTAALLLLTALAAHAQPLLVAPGPARPGARAAQAEVVVIGKVVEVEKETVEAPPYAGAPRDLKAQFKVAVLKADEIVIGGRGLTQFRVGFPADAAPVAAAPAPPAVPAVPGAGRVRRNVQAAVALEAGMEGCFFLSRYPGADFYVAEGVPLARGDAGYAKQLEDVRKVARAIEQPAAALKAKDLADRYLAARAILERYQASRPGQSERQPIPDEENRLILDLLTELPWVPADGMADSPSRSALWPLVRPAELGFRQPKVAGGNYNEIMEAATAAFLKDNRDKLKIRRYAE